MTESEQDDEGQSSFSITARAHLGHVVQANAIHGDITMHQYNHFCHTCPGHAVAADTGHPPIEWPHLEGPIPPLVPCFQDRWLRLGLDRDARGTVALTGVGGGGKTQVAASYVLELRTRGKVDLVIWTMATRRGDIVDRFAQLATRLTGRRGADSREDAQLTLNWLATTTKRWVVVIDDLQHPLDLQDLIPPESPVGLTIITTRRADQALVGRTRHVRVPPFSPAQAHRYLTARFANDPELADDTAHIANDLGYLPMALSQAATFILDRQIRCTEYRRRLAERKSFEAVVPEPSALPDDHRMSINAAYSLSIDHASNLSPQGVAQPLLEIASHLGGHGIPLNVLTTEPTLGYIEVSRGCTTGVEDVLDGVSALRRLSLADQPSPGLVTVHSLIRAAVREQMPARRRWAAARSAGDSLFAVWKRLPDVHPYEAWIETAHGSIDDTCLSCLRANTAELDEVGGDHLWQPDMHEVLRRHALAPASSDEIGKLYRKARDLLGEQHPTTGSLRADYLRRRHRTGEVEDNRATLVEKLRTQTRAFGVFHVVTRATRSELNAIRDELSDYCDLTAELATEMHEILRLKYFHDPSAPLVHGDLRYLPNQLNLAYSEALLEHDRTRGTLPPDWDLPFLRTFYATYLHACHKALTCGNEGRSSEAIRVLEKLKSNSSSILGSWHQRTRTVHNLVLHWQAAASGADVADVADVRRWRLSDNDRVFGVNHPHNVFVPRVLGESRGTAGDILDAIADLRQVLADSAETLGPDHLVVPSVRLSLVRLLIAAEQPGEALTQAQSAVDARREWFDETHPALLTARWHLGQTLLNLGEVKHAIDEFRQIEQTALPALGDQHPDIRRTRDQINACR